MSDTTGELAEVNPEAVKFIAEHFPTKEVREPDPVTGEVKTAPETRGPKLCWKSFLLQQDEASSLQVKLKFVRWFLVFLMVLDASP